MRASTCSLIVLAVVASGLAPIFAIEAAPVLQRFEFSEPHMGTLVRLTLYTETRARAVRAAKAGFARIAELDRTLSDYRPDSELRQLEARAGTGSVRVSEDLFVVLAASERLAKRTAGAFDVTAGALTHLWRRARRLNDIPTSDRLRRAREASGHRWLRLDAEARTATLTRAGVELDAGGVAKGYAADEALDAIAAEGVNRALVAVAGDIAAGDAPPGREGWTAALEGLAVAGAPHLSPVSLRRAAISSSGDSEQWMSAGGVRYSHILDLRTGWPMTGRTVTSVIARCGLDADALSTAVAVLGPDRGAALIDDVPGAAALWMIADGTGTVTVRRSSRWPDSKDGGPRRVESSPDLKVRPTGVVGAAIGKAGPQPCPQGAWTSR